MIRTAKIETPIVAGAREKNLRGFNNRQNFRLPMADWLDNLARVNSGPVSESFVGSSGFTSPLPQALMAVDGLEPGFHAQPPTWREYLVRPHRLASHRWREGFYVLEPTRQAGFAQILLGAQKLGTLPKNYRGPMESSLSFPTV
jgi:hypothetical protein